ncbi:MAG TPA: LysR substrate-binding domain-containing protein [Kiloniellaceae bacterium]|nr:LysR substrate-binding domain-containing protein [Kiloniellaceae bacterium]
MRSRYYENLRTFCVVARHGSFSAAAEALHLTKGAVSHQIRQLEEELGFVLFHRLPRGVTLSAEGQALLSPSLVAFQTVERAIDGLREQDARSLTIGCSTYFASRWLSPRLMTFLSAQPKIRLRVQPLIDQLALRSEGIDLAIRWGNGRWTDVELEPLFACPAWPTGDAAALKAVQGRGLAAAFDDFTLLRDRDDSRAWSDWFAAAGLKMRARPDTLIIPDPNVRVQAVIDGQGVALNDALLVSELSAGRLHRLSGYELSDYGYFLAYAPGAADNPDVQAFRDWIRGQAPR